MLRATQKSGAWECNGQVHVPDEELAQQVDELPDSGGRGARC
jgi:hypothetical protein